MSSERIQHLPTTLNLQSLSVYLQVLISQQLETHWIMYTRTQRQRYSQLLAMIVVMIDFSTAQSIGYHPNLNMGFNPYLSSVYGYGLGLPYGAYGMSSLRPWLPSPITGLSSYGFGSSLLGKAHANSFLTKFVATPYQYYKPESYVDNNVSVGAAKTYKIIKPLIKAGALLTTAAILGMKTLEAPIKLNPSGMIMSGRQN